MSLNSSIAKAVVGPLLKEKSLVRTFLKNVYSSQYCCQNWGTVLDTEQILGFIILESHKNFDQMLSLSHGQFSIEYSGGYDSGIVGLETI